MPPSQFANVRLLVAEPNPHAREALRHALSRLGFASVLDCDRFRTVEKAVAENDVDLLIADAELEGGSVTDMLYRLRHHETGNNPFVVAMVLTDDPTPQRVKSIIDAGADDLILKPVAPGTLIDRINTLAVARKPFVVTTDYIGPDRRKKPRPGSMDVELLNVPNPLVDRKAGDRDKFQKAIDRAARMINEHKIERHADQIAWLVERILPFWVVGEQGIDVEAMLDRLIYVSEDIGRRLMNSRHAHVSDLCRSVLLVASRMRERPNKPDHKDIQLLPELAASIRRSFKESGRAAELARDITETVAGT